MSKPYAQQHLPLRGMFTLKNPKPAVADLMMRALKGAAKGGFIMLRGHPVMVREVSLHTDNSMMVRYERVGSKPRTAARRDLNALKRELLANAGGMH